jgi:hypothetical protein
MMRRFASRRECFRGAALALLAGFAAASARAELPSAESALSAMGWSAAEAQQVSAGQIVQRSLDPTSPRELASAMAFEITAPPSEVVKELRSGVLVHVDPTSLAEGVLEGEAGVEALAKLDLTEDELKLYAKPAPGDDLNLSDPEIRELGSKGGNVVDLVRKNLLTRYRAYRSQGLAGVAPYARGGGKTSDVGADLRLASQAGKGFEKYVPDFYRLIQSYPQGKPAGLAERFRWRRISAHGTPTTVLEHGMVVPEGAGFALAQRQFYVSRGFNCEQALAALIPSQKGTLVLYVNRTSTDQVTGFGGGTKRSLGTRLMASQLEELFERFRKSEKR